MRCIITTNDVTYPGVRQLLQAAKTYGLDMVAATLDAKDTVAKIESADCIIPRISPTNYRVYAALLPHIVRHRDVIRDALAAFSKVESADILSRAGVQVPKTQAIRAEDIVSCTTFPMVAKVEYGNQGQGVYLLETARDAHTIAQQHKGQNMILQEYIAGSRGTDIRLFVVGNQVVAAMKRTNQKGAFLANLHAGAEGTSYTPTARESDLALQAHSAFHSLLFSGVDIIDSPSGPLVLEVNPSPGFGIVDITGQPVAQLIVQYIAGLPNDRN